MLGTPENTRIYGREGGTTRRESERETNYERNHNRRTHAPRAVGLTIGLPPRRICTCYSGSRCTRAAYADGLPRRDKPPEARSHSLLSVLLPRLERSRTLQTTRCSGKTHVNLTSRTQCYLETKIQMLHDARYILDKNKKFILCNITSLISISRCVFRRARKILRLLLIFNTHANCVNFNIECSIDVYRKMYDIRVWALELLYVCVYIYIYILPAYRRLVIRREQPHHRY